LLGNIVKYALRANHKGCFGSDIGKLGVYTKMLQAVMLQDCP
jgi:hypothetical protein